MAVSQISKTRRVILWLIVVCVIGLVIVSITKLIVHEMRPRERVAIGGSVFQADIADTEQLRNRGLGGRKSLGGNEAMLFVFDSDSYWSIWMKGMNFPIDIVWLDKNRVVSHIEHNVYPDSEPHESYTPKNPARYVLEIAAGQAIRSGIKVGSEAKFQLGRVGR